MPSKLTGVRERSLATVSAVSEHSARIPAWNASEYAHADTARRFRCRSSIRTAGHRNYSWCSPSSCWPRAMASAYSIANELPSRRFDQ